MQRSELGALGNKVRELVRRGIAHRVTTDAVVRLLDVMASHMTLAEGVDIGDGDNEKSAHVQDILKALDAISVSLLILVGWRSEYSV